MTGSMKIHRTVVRRGKVSSSEDVKHNLRYWLSRSAEERIAEVELLSSQVDGTQERLQRVARVVKR